MLEFVCLPWSEVCSARVTSLLLLLLLTIIIEFISIINNNNRRLVTVADVDAFISFIHFANFLYLGGFLTWTGDRLRATYASVLLSVAVCCELTIHGAAVVVD